MTPVVLLILLLALDWLALRYGHDSREHPQSEEEHLAAHGMAWHA